MSFFPDSFQIFIQSTSYQAEIDKAFKEIPTNKVTLLALEALKQHKPIPLEILIQSSKQLQNKILALQNLYQYPENGNVPETDTFRFQILFANAINQKKSLWDELSEEEKFKATIGEIGFISFPSMTPPQKETFSLLYQFIMEDEEDLEEKIGIVPYLYALAEEIHKTQPESIESSIRATFTMLQSVITEKTSFEEKKHVLHRLVSFLKITSPEERVLISKGFYNLTHPGTYNAIQYAHEQELIYLARSIFLSLSTENFKRVFEKIGKFPIEKITYPEELYLLKSIFFFKDCEALLHEALELPLTLLEKKDFSEKEKLKILAYHLHFKAFNPNQELWVNLTASLTGFCHPSVRIKIYLNTLSLYIENKDISEVEKAYALVSDFTINNNLLGSKAILLLLDQYALYSLEKCEERFAFMERYIVEGFSSSQKEKIISLIVEFFKKENPPIEAPDYYIELLKDNDNSLQETFLLTSSIFDLLGNIPGFSMIEEEYQACCPENATMSQKIGCLTLYSTEEEAYLYKAFIPLIQPDMGYQEITSFLSLLFQNEELPPPEVKELLKAISPFMRMNMGDDQLETLFEAFQEIPSKEQVKASNCAIAFLGKQPDIDEVVSFIELVYLLGAFTTLERLLEKAHQKFLELENLRNPLKKLKLSRALLYLQFSLKIAENNPLIQKSVDAVLELETDSELPEYAYAQVLRARRAFESSKMQDLLQEAEIPVSDSAPVRIKLSMQGLADGIAKLEKEKKTFLEFKQWIQEINEKKPSPLLGPSVFLDLFNNLLTRIDQKIKDHPEKPEFTSLKKDIEKVAINFKDLSKFAAQIMKAPFLTDVDIVPQELYRLYAIAAAILAHTPTLEGTELLSEREDLMLAWLSLIAECIEGHKEGIHVCYRALKIAGEIPSDVKTEGVDAAIENTEAYLQNMIQNRMNQIIESPTFYTELGVSPQALAQKIHYARHTQNMIGPDGGLNVQVRCDPYGGIVDLSFRGLSRDLIARSFYEKLTTSLPIEIKNQINHAIPSLKAKIYDALTGFFNYHEIDHKLVWQLTRPDPLIYRKNKEGAVKPTLALLKQIAREVDPLSPFWEIGSERLQFTNKGLEAFNQFLAEKEKPPHETLMIQEEMFFLFTDFIESQFSEIHEKKLYDREKNSLTPEGKRILRSQKILEEKGAISLTSPAKAQFAHIKAQFPEILSLQIEEQIAFFLQKEEEKILKTPPLRKLFLSSAIKAEKEKLSFRIDKGVFVLTFTDLGCLLLLKLTGYLESSATLDEYEQKEKNRLLEEQPLLERKREISTEPSSNKKPKKDSTGYTGSSSRLKRKIR